MPGKRYPVEELLRRYHWFENLKRETRWSNSRISRFDAGPSDSKVAHTWAHRKHAANDDSVDRLRPTAPLTSLYFDCAPYRLLASDTLSTEVIDELISGYRCEPGSPWYTFPKDSLTPFRPAPTARCRIGDSCGLFHRGDIYAFFALLAELRESEADGAEIEFFERLRWVYRCLPAVGRDARFRPDFGLLCESIENLHHRSQYARRCLGIDWDVIEAQFNDPRFEPDPTKRRKDPVTRKPLALADPTFIVRARNHGRRPAWIGDKPRLEQPDTAMGAPDYDAMLRMQGDQHLFFTFIHTMTLWGISRSDWEAVLGVDATVMEAWFSFNAMALDFLPRMRMVALIIVLNLLHRDSDYRSDRFAALASPRATLNGESIRDYVVGGHALDLLTALYPDGFNTHASNILPLIPAGVLGTRDEFRNELYEFVLQYYPRETAEV